MAVAVVASITGCGSGPEQAKPDPSAVASLTASPSVSATPVGGAGTSPTVPVLPEYPETATHNDAAGQEAFVRHWFDVYNYGTLTGDTAPVKALSQVDELNAVLWDPIDAVYARGGHLTGNTYTVERVVAGPIQPDGSATAELSISLAPGVETGPSGAETPLDSGEVKTYSVSLQFDNQRWRFIAAG